MSDLARRLVAEGFGTGVLVCAVIGSGIMAERLTDDVALALLANTAATAAVLYVLITVLGTLSAQFNPVVTLVLRLRGEVPTGEALGLVAVQIAGGLAGMLLAHAMFGLPLAQVSTTVREGWSQGLSEAVATFGLIVAIFGALRARGAPVAGVVAAYIASAYWFTASTSFANPAVALARTFTDTFSGIAPESLPQFLVAQVAGALLGGLFAGWLFGRQA
jgi:glycerol uptake facilitator-like aquaporin